MEKIKLTDELDDKIVDAIENLEEYDARGIEQKVSEIAGSECEIYEEYIDDGCRKDEEDEYVMRACFSVANSDITIRVYFGNNTRKIGYVYVGEE